MGRLVIWITVQGWKSARLFIPETLGCQEVSSLLAITQLFGGSTERGIRVVVFQPVHYQGEGYSGLARNMNITFQVELGISHQQYIGAAVMALYLPSAK